MHLPPLFGFDIKIDKNFNIKEKEIIIKCIMDWNESTNQLIILRIISMEMERITFESDNVIHILKAKSSDKLVKMADRKYTPTILGFAFYSKKQLFAVPIVDRLYDQNSFYKVMLHELGHCLIGWVHLDTPTGVMYSKLVNPQDRKITYADLELLINNIRKFIKI